MRIASLSLVLVVILAIPATSARAQGVTAFKTGEQMTGTTKQCYYAFGNNRYTETVSSVTLCPLSIQVAVVPSPSTPAPTPDTPSPSTPHSVTAFKTGERTTGMTKQCYYAFGGSQYTKTIGAVELCPLNIKVRP
jgi:hypothetical protein